MVLLFHTAPKFSYPCQLLRQCLASPNVYFPRVQIQLSHITNFLEQADGGGDFHRRKQKPNDVPGRGGPDLNAFS